jgi:hypothetical protein
MPIKSEREERERESQDRFGEYRTRQQKQQQQRIARLEVHGDSQVFLVASVNCGAFSASSRDRVQNG